MRITIETIVQDDEIEVFYEVEDLENVTFGELYAAVYFLELIKLKIFQMFEEEERRS